MLNPMMEIPIMQINKTRTFIRFTTRESMKQAVFFAAVLFFCFSGKINAQRFLSLQDAISIALENNYDIRLAESDSALLALDYSYRNAVYLPRLNANLGTTWTNNNQQ